MMLSIDGPPRGRLPREPAMAIIPCRLLGADARQHRRRLWRYRHQPALRVPRSDRRRDRRRRGRRASAVLGVLSLILWALIVIVTLKYVADPAARRQQRRGRHARADGAGAARARHEHADRCVLLGIDRRRAVLRRRHHHAGDLGAVGGRRPQGRDAGLRALRRAADRRDPGRAVRRAVARHRAGRGVLRPDHAGLVRRDRGRRALSHRRRSRRARRAQSAGTRSVFLDEPRHDRLHHARRGVPRRHRRRGALRRPRPFRPPADPGRLAGRSCCRRWRSTISARARWCSPIPRRSRTRSSCSIRTGRCCRWSCSRPSRP